VPERLLEPHTDESRRFLERGDRKGSEQEAPDSDQEFPARRDRHGDIGHERKTRPPKIFPAGLEPATVSALRCTRYSTPGEYDSGILCVPPCRKVALSWKFGKRQVYPTFDGAEQ